MTGTLCLVGRVGRQTLPGKAVSEITQAGFQRMHVAGLDGDGQASLNQFVCVIRHALSHPEQPSIRVWRSQADLSTHSVTVPVYPVVEKQTAGAWRLCTDTYLLDKVRGLRDEKSLCETGGCLVVSVDTQRQIVYVVDALPSPPDSEESPTGYVRGREGLLQEAERLSAATAGWLEYTGEWHSHPPG